ncbi:MAG: isopenicillin N synthase family dioxygenase [Prochloraceae cyanobacterium]
MDIPIIDISELVTPTKDGDRFKIAAQIGQACREHGFFYIIGHGVDQQLQQQLELLSQKFFATDAIEKLKISMSKGGRAWRGYFPVGDELTNGLPDLKEGIYFGAELSDFHPLVKINTPLHGPNLFPASLPELREVVLNYIEAMTQLGHTVMGGIALSLGLEESYFATHYTKNPLVLFRIFNYPPHSGKDDSQFKWSVGEHTDYGLLTILKQDMSGGLEIKTKGQWIAAPPIPNSFVCNIGDMLDRITGGYYLSTPHRVYNKSFQNRLSFPFFFDPNFNAEVKPIDLNKTVRDNFEERWDRTSVHEFQGTYGDYILGKVSKVFPDLRRQVIQSKS